MKIQKFTKIQNIKPSILYRYFPWLLYTPSPGIRDHWYLKINWVSRLSKSLYRRFQQSTATHIPRAEFTIEGRWGQKRWPSNWTRYRFTNWTKLLLPRRKDTRNWARCDENEKEDGWRWKIWIIPRKNSRKCILVYLYKMCCIIRT